MNILKRITCGYPNLGDWVISSTNNEIQYSNGKVFSNLKKHNIKKGDIVGSVTTEIDHRNSSLTIIISHNTKNILKIHKNSSKVSTIRRDIKITEILE